MIQERPSPERLPALSWTGYRQSMSLTADWLTTPIAGWLLRPAWVEDGSGRCAALTARSSRHLLLSLVGVAGFEPTAPRSQSPGKPCAVV
jgi:hypothetical protein